MFHFLTNLFQRSIFGYGTRKKKFLQFYGRTTTSCLSGGVGSTVQHPASGSGYMYHNEKGKRCSYMNCVVFKCQRAGAIKFTVCGDGKKLMLVLGASGFYED